MMHLVLLLLLLVEPAHAAVIWSSNFDSLSTSGDGCTEISTLPEIALCKEVATRSDISIVTSIPGYAGSMPSGANVVRMFADSTAVQTEVGIRIGDPSSAGYNAFIPPDFWFQFAWYINNTSGEVSVTTTRPLKIMYPMRSHDGTTSCTLASDGCVFILEGTRGDSYNPFNDTSLSAVTDGSMYIAARDMVPSTDASWAGAVPGDENKLGQTSLAEWIKPGRWNILRCHSDQSNTSAIALDCWIGAMGSPLVQVMNWHGGATVEGSAFTWSTAISPPGHRVSMITSTVPANNTTGTTLYMYFDDIYYATSESDLPTYTASTGGSVVSGTTRFVGAVRMQ